jgi:hypothetical protein
LLTAAITAVAAAVRKGNGEVKGGHGGWMACRAVAQAESPSTAPLRVCHKIVAKHSVSVDNSGVLYPAHVSIDDFHASERRGVRVAQLHVACPRTRAESVNADIRLGCRRQRTSAHYAGVLVAAALKLEKAGAGDAVEQSGRGGVAHYTP